MSFYMPVHIFDGRNCVVEHAGEICSYGHKALIVTGRHSAVQSGALADVIQALQNGGCEWCVFDEIEENPSVETVVRGAEAGRSADCDFVIGIGGGSPLDAAKAIAFLMKREEIHANDLYDASLKADALSVIAVPTTCGTGSEVTGVSVLTVHDQQTKRSIPHKIYPQIAFLDGKYIQGASHRLIVNTSLDALAHMLESYESVKRDTFSEAAVFAGLDAWKRICHLLCETRQPDDEEALLLMKASCFAGIAIAQTGTSIPHALSYPLTYLDTIPHGPACAVFLARYFAYAEEADKEVFLKHAGFDSENEFDTFMNDLVGNVQVRDTTLAKAYEAVRNNPARLKGCRFEVNEAILKHIVFG